jgi:hypothetical protein
VERAAHERCSVAYPHPCSLTSATQRGAHLFPTPRTPHPLSAAMGDLWSCSILVHGAPRTLYLPQTRVDARRVGWAKGKMLLASEKEGIRCKGEERDNGTHRSIVDASNRPETGSRVAPVRDRRQARCTARGPDGHGKYGRVCGQLVPHRKAKSLG